MSEEWVKAEDPYTGEKTADACADCGRFRADVATMGHRPTCRFAPESRKRQKTSERTDAIRLANKLLDEPNADPDDDLRTLSRQLLRHVEVVAKLKADLNATLDPTGDLISSNRDAILQKHEEAFRRVRKALLRIRNFAAVDSATNCTAKYALAVLDALSLFHPMHGESWAGWPEDSPNAP